MTQCVATGAPGGPSTALVKYGSRAPVPPPSAAGFTHSTWPAVDVWPESRLTPVPGRPNSVNAGGLLGNDEYAITQPVWPAAVQPGTCWKLPPTTLPTGTWTFPPRTIADTSCFRSAGFASIWLRIRRISIAAPWEWPISTNGRPWLSCAR